MAAPENLDAATTAQFYDMAPEEQSPDITVIRQNEDTLELALGRGTMLDLHRSFVNPFRYNYGYLAKQWVNNFAQADAAVRLRVYYAGYQPELDLDTIRKKSHDPTSQLLLDPETSANLEGEERGKKTRYLPETAHTIGVAVVKKNCQTIYLAEIADRASKRDRGTMRIAYKLMQEQNILVVKFKDQLVLPGLAVMDEQEPDAFFTMLNFELKQLLDPRYRQAPYSLTRGISFNGGIHFLSDIFTERPVRQVRKNERQKVRQLAESWKS